MGCKERHSFAASRILVLPLLSSLDDRSFAQRAEVVE